jgi:hypothetical protein
MFTVIHFLSCPHPFIHPFYLPSFFWDRISLHSPTWSQTHNPASASEVLGLQVCTITLGYNISFSEGLTLARQALYHLNHSTSHWLQYFIQWFYDIEIFALKFLIYLFTILNTMEIKALNKNLYVYWLTVISEEVIRERADWRGHLLLCSWRNSDVLLACLQVHIASIVIYGIVFSNSY